MSPTDLCYTPATKLLPLIRSKKLSPVELTKAVLGRIERLNPKLNAFCTITADAAMKAAREAEQAVMKWKKLGPIHGIPFSIKDLNFTKGVRTMSGSHIFADRVPDHDAPFVRRLTARQAHFRIADRAHLRLGFWRHLKTGCLADFLHSIYGMLDAAAVLSDAIVC